MYIHIFSISVYIQIHSACIGQLEEREANERVCTHRDLWHLVLAPRAVTHRQSVKSHVEQEREEEAVDGEEREGGGETMWQILSSCVCVFGGYRFSIQKRRGSLIRTPLLFPRTDFHAIRTPH